MVIVVNLQVIVKLVKQIQIPALHVLMADILMVRPALANNAIQLKNVKRVLL
jgi:hypothetical protein